MSYVKPVFESLAQKFLNSILSEDRRAAVNSWLLLYLLIGTLLLGIYFKTCGSFDSCND